MVDDAGGKAVFLDLKDYPMPIYDGDIEDADGLPDNAKKLKELFIKSDGFIISSPEYNSSIAPLLKNAIDWISRKGKNVDEPSLVAFKGKFSALLAASPGALGGLRGLVHLRSILGNIGVIVLPDQAAVGNALEAFSPDGSLKNENQQKMVGNVVNQLVDMVRRYKK